MKITAKVEPKTVGQYTGVKDKNGTNIFEGDIIRHGYEKKNFAVVYLGTDAAFYLTDDLDKCPCSIRTRHRTLGLETGYYLVVIGNIHDNPELLEEEK